jgi:hypothetical protein
VENESADAAGMGERQFLRDRAAERPAEHVLTLDLERVEQGCGVRGQRRHRDGLLAAFGSPEPATVVGNHAVLLREWRHQRFPETDRSGRAHDEQEPARRFRSDSR